VVSSSLRFSLLICFLVTNLTIQSVFSQDKARIEDRIDSSVKSEPKVMVLLERLRNLRKNDQRLGAKHPSKDNLRREIESVELALAEYLDRADRRDQSASEGDMRSSQSPPIDPRESRWDSIQEGGTLIEDQERTDGTSTIVATRFGSEETTPFYQSDLLAYPWIDTRNHQGFGCFPCSEFVWGIENTANGRGFVWKWVDNWFVKRKHLFMDLEGEILCFLPSFRLESDGLCFALVKKDIGEDKALFELIVGRLEGFDLHNNEKLEVDSLVSYQAEKNSGAYLEYLPDSGAISIFPQSTILIREVESSLPILRSDESSVTFSVPGFSERVGPTLIERQDEESVFEIRGNRRPCVLMPRRVDATKSVRPFWMKRGKNPSVVPNWYSQRYRTIEHWPSSKTDSALCGSKLAIAVNSLKPGERLLVHSGTYSIPHRFDVRLRGNPSAPIFVEAASGERVIITRADDNENLMDIGNSQYCVVSGFEFVGGSTGIRIRSSSNLMVSNCVIHDVGNNGISANTDDSSGLFLVDNEIYNTNGNAEGLYLGSHDGKARVSNSMVSGNYIHDLGNGATNQGDGVEIKNLSFGNVIKWNYIARTKFPGVTVYSAGENIEKPNIIEQNAIFDSLDCGIQVNSDAIVRNNFVFGGRLGVVSKPFDAEPHSLLICHNTIFSEGSALKASQWNSKDIVFVNNALYSRSGNYYYAGTGMAVCSLNQHFPVTDSNFNPEAIEMFKRSPRPSANGQLDARTDTRYTTSVDFFEEVRPGESDIGAFSYRRHAPADRSLEAMRLRFRLEVIDGRSARVSIDDQDPGGNKLRHCLIRLPENQGQESMVSWLLVLKDSPSGEHLDVWAKGDRGDIFCASLDPSTGLDSLQNIPLQPIVSFSESIAFATCNQYGETVVSSPKGLLVVPIKPK
jgi:hypothetical protein